MPKTITMNNVAGLDRTLRALPREASVELRDASERIAAIVADRTAARMRLVGGVLALVAPTVRVRRDRVPKVVMGGTTRLPPRDGRARTGARQAVGDVMWGGEFGSDRFAQFDPWRGNGEGAGYALWPTIRGERDMIMDEYGDALIKAIDSAARKND